MHLGPRKKVRSLPIQLIQQPKYVVRDEIRGVINSNVINSNVCGLEMARTKR